ncbi:lipoprotein insertase outer membrane protein LolB [Hydrogenophaga aquatica]
MKALLPSRRTLLSASALSVALWLAGCATPPPPPTGSSEFWTGRLTLQIDGNPAQSFSAGFELSGNPAQGEIKLFSPFGQTVASATWTNTGAALHQGEETRHYPDMASLTAELTGTALPISPLFDWLKGLPATLDGWEADLTQHPQGRLSARRLFPLPGAHLRVVFQ